ncbi:uroporphyrinogen-III synthase [Aquisalimonas asiatica]|uniref:Uroporphyrinogen-III synthase n=1 Tax=Aquisalimonas asiatica TaxID=406100 RepID=A0A1H8QZI2_9GAMM|nr:uroporphyrinogen-III synthase [Aquisalimonas asiatica]SEO59730.1 uroporphyrinogen-III synthase [Aquisalimonas asiatica]
MSEQELEGLTVAVPESRELDLFARMLEERGAAAFRCPLVRIADSPDEEAVHGWLDRFCDNPPDELILLTGEGLRRLLGFAERRGQHKAFISALSHPRIIARGPKPGRALRPLGLKPDLLSEQPTSAGVIDTLAALDLNGHRVGVQLYGEEPNRPLMEALHDAGAEADPVAPYVYLSDRDDPAVMELIQALDAGSIDVIAFTSKSQVQRLWEVAEGANCRDALERGMGRTLVAAIGPVVEDALAARGRAADLAPEKSYFMKPLVREMVARLRS